MASFYYLSLLYFVLLIFFILIRASIIDLKTMFVPLNIVISMYFVATLSVFILGNYVSSLIGLFVGIIPLTIISFLLRRHVTEEIVLDENCDTKKFRPILYFLIFLIGILMLSTSVDKGLIYFIGSMIMFFVLKHASSSLKTFFNLIGVLSCLILFEINGSLIVLLLAASLSEWITNALFKKFDDTDKLVKEEKEIMKNGGDVYGAIGFGDILIFGAIGLFVGVRSLIPILFLSGVFHLFFTLIYFLYTGNRQKSLPFIPGIAFGVIYFFSSIDLFEMKNLLFGFL